MRDNWNVGDECQVRTFEGRWIKGTITKLYRHFVEVRINPGNNLTTTIKSYAQIRGPNAAEIVKDQS